MEKYGVIPKKFTAAWFEYIWEYYKIHIIVTVLIIAAVIYTWVTIASRTYYDLYVCFATNYSMSEQSKEMLEENLKSTAQDVNGDGEINVCIFDYSLPENYDNAEYAKAMETKFQLELQAGDSFVFIVSEDKANRLMNDSSLEGCFEEISSWCGREGGNKYFAKIDNSDVLKDAGILYSNSYIGVRQFNYREGDKKDILQRENAVAAAKFILGS